MKKYIFLLPLPIFIFSGCTLDQTTNAVNPVSMKQQLKIDRMDIFNENLKKFVMKIIPNKDTVSSVIKRYNKTNPYKRIIVNKIKHNVVLKYPYQFSNLNDFIDYVNNTTNIRITLKRFNETLYKIVEHKNKNYVFNKDYLINIDKLNFMDQPISFTGKITQAEAIKMIEHDFHIPIVYKQKTENISHTITKNTNTDKTKTENIKILVKTQNQLKTHFIDGYTGTIKKLIQTIAIEDKLFINYEQGTVILSDMDIRSFSLKIPNLDYKTADMFKNITNLELKPYKDLKNQLKSILSKEAILSINPSTGNILIKGNYDDLRKAQIIIKNFQKIYSKTISMDVYIYQVDLNRNNKFGVSFDTNLISKYLTNSVTTGIAINKNILTNTNTPNLSTVSYLKNWNGTDAKFSHFFLNFLNQFGNARILTKPKLETINDIPVSLKITTSQDYVSKIDETTSNDTNSNVTNTTTSTNVTKNTIETGFKLGLYPVAEGDKIKIIVKPVISQLLALTPFHYGSKTDPKTIQLVTKDTKDFSQIINIRNGEVAIISGYIFEKNKAQKNTLPFMDPTKDSILDPLFSTKQKDIQRTEMIIAIKARVKDD